MNARPGCRIGIALQVCIVAAALLALAPRVVRAEPASHKRLDIVGHWVPTAFDPATADSAWSGLAAQIPTLSDSLLRSFAWSVMYSAAEALGRVDSMRVAAESSFVYKPTDGDGFFTFAVSLKRLGQHLDWAEHYATRAIEVGGPAWSRSRGFRDYMWLADIQITRREDSAATATLERSIALGLVPDAWTCLRLGDLYARVGRRGPAIDRLTTGLSLFPRDSADAVDATARLDSLVALQGGDLRALHTRIARALERAKRSYFVAAHRDGHAAPKTPLLDLASGRQVSPAAGRGITVLYFWATWCGPCRHSLPGMQEWAARPRTPPVRLVTVNAEGGPMPEAIATVRQFVAERGLKLPVLMADSAQVAAWKVLAYPTVIVLRDGRVEFRGYAESVETGLEAELASLGSALKKKD